MKITLSKKEVAGITCADCGSQLTPEETQFYLAWGEIQNLDGSRTGLCKNDFVDRVNGENWEDLIAEFCG